LVGFNLLTHSIAVRLAFVTSVARFVYYALRLSCAALEAFSRLQSFNSQHSCSTCVRNERCSFYPHSGCGVRRK
ncbi:hypothetical protein, partial [Acinetobacter tjernbergiae]|uniref:hypothetical protein n=1 Tax=Acinetobacter tjernbergiae TaxID=202955 RepID=UPI001BB28C82